MAGLPPCEDKSLPPNEVESTGASLASLLSSESDDFEIVKKPEVAEDAVRRDSDNESGSSSYDGEGELITIVKLV